jgi:hypothetical protein
MANPAKLTEFKTLMGLIVKTPTRRLILWVNGLPF